MESNKTTNCKDLIDNFLRSSNEKLSLTYQHLGKVNLDEATCRYNNITCNFNTNDLNYLADNGKKYKTETYYDSIYVSANMEYIVPSKAVCTSN